MRISHTTFTIATAILIVAGAAWATARAQGQSQALGPSSGGSLAELTAEVRQMRIVIQESGKTQMQVQALNIALTAQQGRMSQLATRIDKLDDELAFAAGQTEEATARTAQMLAAQGKSTTPDDRRIWENEIQQNKIRASRLAEEENRLRARHQELLALYRADEDRWRDLVAKLEEIIKK